MQMTTIAAIATPSGYGGIGIVKITGPEAVAIARRIFHKRCAHPPERNTAKSALFESHRLYYGVIKNPNTGQNVDEVLLAVMQAPHSYTREDVVEIQAHAGPVALQTVLEIVLKAGAQMAAPGEFTRRAFLNGRIDLTQAEAVMDIIHAKSEQALAAAGAQIGGRLRKKIEGIKNELTAVYAVIEAGIDFPEETGAELNIAGMATELDKQVVCPIDQLLRQYATMHFFREGIALAIVGKPNVGKSSLLNCLLQQDRAIVTEMPGTTRDVISERLIINGIPVDILDTAGIHRTTDCLENMGIQKAHACIDAADIVLFVVDASQSLDAADMFISERLGEKNRILVLNKIDLIDEDKKRYPRIPDEWKKRPFVQISAKYGQGLDRLQTAIAEMTIGTINATARTPIIPNLRHKQLLENCLADIKRACAGMVSQQPMELVAIDLKSALAALDDILGIGARDDILDQIFKQFCIGK